MNLRSPEARGKHAREIGTEIRASFLSLAMVLSLATSTFGSFLSEKEAVPNGKISLRWVKVNHKLII